MTGGSFDACPSSPEAAPLEAIEAVCGAGEGEQRFDVFSSVSSLLDMSLVYQTRQQGEEARWEMLETVREYARAANLAGELLAISQEVGDRESELSALYTLGMVALRQGERPHAMALYSRCLNLADEIGSRRDSSMALARLGEIAYEQGDYALAERRYRESLLHATAFDDEEVVGVTLLGLARVAKAERRYWRAAHLLGAAEQRINISADLDALARVAYERDLASLQTYLGEAVFTQACKAGSEMTPEQALVVPEPDSALPMTHLYPDGLTRREVEVLALVAAGLTDTQVAEKLILSPRTVQGHLRSIYNKISVNSRSAATRYAIEHRLI